MGVSAVLIALTMAASPSEATLHLPTDAALRCLAVDRFACRPGFESLVVFHESRRDGPVAAPRFDAAFAQQDATFVFRHAADHHLRIQVVDGSAGIADVSRQEIAVRNFEDDAGATVAAEIHGTCKRSPFWCRERESNPHAFLGQRILSPPRLPVPPSRRGGRSIGDCPGGQRPDCDLSALRGIQGYKNAETRGYQLDGHRARRGTRR